MEHKIKVLLSESEVNHRIKEIGEQISQDFCGKKGTFDLCTERRSLLYM